MCMNCLHCKLELVKIEGKKHFKKLTTMFIHTVVEYRYMTCSYMCIPCIPYHNGVCYFLFFFLCSITCTCIILDKLNCWLIKKIVNLIMHIILFCDTCVYSFYTFSRFNMIMNYNEIDILNKDMYIMENKIMYPCIVLFSIIRFLFVILST